MTTGLEYRVKYSPEEREWVGTCDQYPSLSFFADSKVEAFVGIVTLAEQTFMEEGSPVVKSKTTVLDGYYVTFEPKEKPSP